MKTLEKLRNRFEELSAALDEVAATLKISYDPPWRPGPNVHGGYDSPIKIQEIDRVKWYEWAVSARHLLKLVLGESSAHFREFEATFNKTGDLSWEIQALKGIFLGAKADYERGLAFRLDAAVAGEIFGDFVALAKEALHQEQKDVAGVLACAALEDTLKRIGTANGLEVADKEMPEVINALKAHGLISGTVAKLLSPMPKIRDHAMHAQWDQITKADVGAVVGFVEQLILSHLSS